MDSHQIRDENSRLRIRITQNEEKMRLLADALEKRNIQITELNQLYKDLQEQFREAQDAANAAAELLNGRDGMIEQYRLLIEKLKNDNLEQSKLSGKDIEKLREDLKNEQLHFIETLNRLSQLKVPAEEAFRKYEADLERKEKEFAELRQKYKDLIANFEALSEENGNREAYIQRLLREKALLEQDNSQLNNQLEEIKSGYQQSIIIESFKKDIEAMRQKLNETLRENKALKSALHKRKEQVNSLRTQVEDEDNQIRALEDKILDLQRQVQEVTDKADRLRQEKAKAVQNEMSQVKRCSSLEAQNNCLNEQIIILQEKVDKFVKQTADHANDRVKNIRNDSVYKTKIALIKKRAQEEVAKRLSAEEAVYSVKEENFKLKKDIAILKDQLADAKMADVEPLVQLLKDLRVELIEIDTEYLDLIKSIPPAQPIELNEVPKGICESSAAIIAQIAAKSSQIVIENQELRVILQRISRFASEFHQIATVISKYPILSTDDIGMDEPYGNWVLPVDVEHLQRTVIKLHEILTRKRSQ